MGWPIVGHYSIGGPGWRTIELGETESPVSWTWIGNISSPTWNSSKTKQKNVKQTDAFLKENIIYNQYLPGGLNVKEEGFVNWWEKLWKAMDAVCVNKVEGLLGVAGNLRWPPWPFKCVAIWLPLGIGTCPLGAAEVVVVALLPNRPNRLGWLKLLKYEGMNPFMYLKNVTRQNKYNST